MFKNENNKQINQVIDEKGITQMQDMQNPGLRFRKTPHKILDINFISNSEKHKTN